MAKGFSCTFFVVFVVVVVAVVVVVVVYLDSQQFLGHQGLDPGRNPAS